MKYELASTNDISALSHNLPVTVEDFDFVLKIKDYVYPVFDTYNIKEFKEDNVLCINYWTKIALLDGLTGELLLYTGLEDSFVGIESLKNRYLIVSDTALIMFNKENYYPTYRAVLTDFVVDYELINDNEIKLKFAVDSEMTHKFDAKK